MQDAVAAEDEGRLEVPAEWREAIHPRRGSALVSGVKIPAHTGSTAEWEALLVPEVLRNAGTAIQNPTTLPPVAEALRRFAVEPTPLAAAALLHLARQHDYRMDQAAHLDAWVTAFGVPFAAVATVEAARLDAERYPYRGEDVFVRETRNGLPAGDFRAVLLRLRSYLAATDEASYAEAVRRLAELREDLLQRVVVSYLLPTESQWLAEVCLRIGKARLAGRLWRPWVGLLHCSISRAEDVQALRKRAPFQFVSHGVNLGVVATAAEALGEAAVPLFPALLDGKAADAKTKRILLDALARIPGDEAFAALTARLTVKMVQQYAMEAARRFPRRAIRLLATAAAPAEPTAEVARGLLSTMLKQYPDLLDEVRPALCAGERELVDTLLAQIKGRPVVPDEALPGVLADPPWNRRRPPAKAAPGAAELAELRAPAISRVVWRPGEQTEFDRIDRGGSSLDWRKILDLIEKEGTSRSDSSDQVALLIAPEEEARRALRRLRNTFGNPDKVYAWGSILVRFGIDALDPILYSPKGSGNLTNRGAVLQPVVDLRVARVMADWLLRLKSVRSHARSWLGRHGEDAATLLIPDALGTDKQLRPAAEGALRYLAHAHGLDVAEVADRGYGAEVGLAIKRLVSADRLEILPARMPKLPAWLDDTHLPQILLRDRSAAISEQATRNVLAMLSISKPGEPYPGLEIVRGIADPASLTDFARALLAAWRSLDYPSDHSWILTAQGVFGDADTVRRLVPLIHAWPLENGHHRAVAGLDVLIDTGDDAALFQVYRFATAVGLDASIDVEGDGDQPAGAQLDQLVQANPRKALKEQAQQRFARIAADRGLTADELADRMLPTLGFDAGRGVWLDYGPRRFRVGFDERSRYLLRDEAGNPCAALPEPVATDDKELIDAARERLAALTEDVQAVIAHAVLRIESSMSLGRAWSAAEFRALLHGHPVIWRVVRGVVWLCEAEGVTTAFRIAEDGGFADVDDEVFTLPERAVVRAAHPLQLGADLAAWSELFADYEIVQPFAQLGRTINTLTAAERAGGLFNRFKDRTVPIEEVRGLLKRGWGTARAQGYGADDFLKRPTLDGRWLLVSIDPGLNFSWDDAYTRRQEIGVVVLQNTPIPNGSRHRMQSSSIADLDPITVSELIGDLSRLMDGEH
ncbi:MAG TPA: DUF4132 domain-containing protein [Actinospica sp.]|nr:DUF4132 domain-containing protein [Actinospica sp.]